MKNEKDNYNKLLSRLKTVEPEIKSEDVLTDQIMLRISHNRRKNTPSILIWIRTVSSAAAVLLLVLFGYQYSIENQDIKSVSPKKSFHSIKISEMCFSDNEVVGLTDRYACYVRHQKNRKNNFQAFSKHLKSYSNENID